MPRNGRSSRRLGAVIFDADWQLLAFDPLTMYFYAWVKHRGDETEKDHYHIFVHARKEYSLSQWKTFIKCPSAHCELNLKTDDITYLTDGHTTIAGPEQYGKADVTSGKRSDIADALQSLEEGGTVYAAIRAAPQLLPNLNALERMKVLMLGEPPIYRPVTVVVLWGPTSVHKSKRVEDLFTRFSQFHRITKATKDSRWDGYYAQDLLLIDEFSDDQYDVNLLKGLLHGSTMELHARYFNRFTRYTKVVITAQHSPTTWYPGLAKVDRDALMSRIHHVIEVTSPDQEVDLKTLLHF